VKPYECLDTQINLESCGGCVVPYDDFEDEAGGVDCTSLPGVADVECARGRCMVRKCQRGWLLVP
ncbi:hypothetical protein DL93DRAFT_2040149, partial [Clavulina sp. PMI_390]